MLLRRFWDVSDMLLRSYWYTALLRCLLRGCWVAETLLRLYKRCYWKAFDFLLRHCWDVALIMLRRCWDDTEMVVLRRYWDTDKILLRSCWDASNVSNELLDAEAFQDTEMQLENKRCSCRNPLTHCWDSSEIWPRFYLDPFEIQQRLNWGSEKFLWL